MNIPATITLADQHCQHALVHYTELMELTRNEVDAMLRRADEVRTKLRRATRELQRFGEEAMVARETSRTAVSRSTEHPSDADRPR